MTEAFANITKLRVLNPKHTFTALRFIYTKWFFHIFVFVFYANKRFATYERFAQNLNINFPDLNPGFNNLISPSSASPGIGIGKTSSI